MRLLHRAFKSPHTESRRGLLTMAFYSRTMLHNVHPLP